MSRKKTKKSIKKAFFNEIKASIICPITQCIFNEPVKLLLNNKSDGGAVVEKEACEQLLNGENPRCPTTRASIHGYLSMREIAHVTTCYLDIFPEEKINQYQLGTIVFTPAVQVRPFIHDSGQTGALLGFMITSLIYFSQYREIPEYEAMVIIIMGTLFGTLVGETFAEEQPFLSSSRLLELNPFDDFVEARAEVIDEAMARPSYFFS
jgi:hypothetical protein